MQLRFLATLYELIYSVSSNIIQKYLNKICKFCAVMKVSFVVGVVASRRNNSACWIKSV